VVCFPRLDAKVDIDTFYWHLNDVGDTFVGNGHWFEEDPRFFRLGFGWPSTDELRAGLDAIDAAIDAST
jgi:DNA-binding transcriptional MocR family regulator